MILVSCADGLRDCRVADDMLNAYPTAEYCEHQLEPAVRKISRRTEQIFGRCMSADNDLASSDATSTGKWMKKIIFMSRFAMTM